MNEEIKVWNLFVVDTSGTVASRPSVVNFSSKEKMRRHIFDIVRRCKNVDQDFRSALEYNMAPERFDAFVHVFREVQLSNSQPIGLDLWWDEEPQVLL